MPRFFVWAIPVALLAALTPMPAAACGQDQPKEAARDLYGDPLPPGAFARLGTTRLRHTPSWRIVDAAFSPDGKVLVSLGGDSRLRWWDTATGRELHSDPLDSFLEPSLAFAPNGKTVAVAGSRRLTLCEIGAKPRVLPEQPDYVTGVTFAPDSKLLAAYGYATTITLLDPATGKEVRRLAGHGKAVLAAAFSPDGTTLAATGEDFTCRLWDVESGKEVRQFGTNKRRALMVAWSPDGKWLAWWDEEGQVRVVSAATGKEETAFKAADGHFVLDWRQSDLRFRPDGTLQALYWSRHFFQWHPDRGLKSREFESVSGKTGFGRIAADGKIAALWDWDHGTALHLFDLETGKERVVATGHTKWVYEVAAQPGGKWIASASADGTVRLWDPSTAKEVRRWRPSSSSSALAWTTDGKRLVFADYDGKSFFRIVEPGPGKTLARLDTARTWHLALSDDGQRLLAGDFKRLEVWDLAHGKLLRELDDVPETKLPPLKLTEKGPYLTYIIGSLALSSDGTRAAATFHRRPTENCVYLWDTATGKTLPDWPGEKNFRGPVAFTPDGKALVAARERKADEIEIVLWDLGRGRIVRQFPIADPDCGGLALSPDGRLLAVAGYYHCIVQVFEVASGKEITRFQAHNGHAALAFADNGTTLITGGEDTTILLWDLFSTALLKR